MLLRPLDRVKELGDTSMPFSFDVHAMIHSANALKLEKNLHRINPRKEFFRVPLSNIKE